MSSSMDFLMPIGVAFRAPAAKKQKKQVISGGDGGGASRTVTWIFFFFWVQETPKPHCC